MGKTRIFKKRDQKGDAFAGGPCRCTACSATMRNFLINFEPQACNGCQYSQSVLRNFTRMDGVMCGAVQYAVAELGARQFGLWHLAAGDSPCSVIALLMC
eukprot:5617163-Amphidinium_carterae.1